MKYNIYWKGVEVYKNLFLTIVKPDNQDNVRKDYIKYIVLNDNNIIMTFACKEDIDPYNRYLELKGAYNE